MVNEVSREHRQKKPDCQGNLCFDSSSSMQWGFGWRESAKCQICSYVSKRYKLYAEIDTCKRGVKPASVTRGISIALTQTPIASSGVRKICHGGNIPAPSVACLQRTANLVNEVICKENKRDMKRIREELKEINKYRGLPQNVINVQADGMYNNNLYSGVGKTPFQPATQASYTVAETITSKKQIVAAEQVNKLCSKHGFHTQEETECDNKSGPCSATASIETTIGDEYRWAKSCFLDLHHDGLEVKYLTTDADSGAFRAATDLYDNKITSTEPVHQLDTRHLAENHRKQMNSCSRLLNMMPGHNVEYRKYLRNRFALDLSRRCTAEFESVFTKENGDFSKITEKLKYLITAIKRCYAGDHYGCNLHSRVCKGAKNNNWLVNSAFLTKNFKISLNIPDNHDTMLDWIEFRLGEDMLNKTRLNSNTQKVEGTNRAIKKCLPNNTTFPHNCSGRFFSAIHAVNNGPGVSLMKLCTAAECPIPKGSRVARQLLQEQKRAENKKETEKSIEFKLKRSKRKSLMYKLHESTREKNKYVKGQLLKDRINYLSQRRRKQNLNKYEESMPSTSDHGSYTRPFCSRAGKRHGGSCLQT